MLPILCSGITKTNIGLKVLDLDKDLVPFGTMH